MILAEVRDYLRSRGQASLAEIARHLGAHPDAVRAMLEVWIAKGRVRRVPACGGSASGCRQCDPAQTEVYVWGEIPASGVRGCRTD